MAFPKAGTQYSFADLAREARLAPGPISLGDPNLRAIAEKTAGQSMSMADFEGSSNYQIPASLRFTASKGSNYLVRTCPAGANPQRYTISVWYKVMSAPGVQDNYIMGAYNSAGNYDLIYHAATGEIGAYAYVGSAYRWRLSSVDKYSFGQWHHIVIAADISGADPERVKMWFDGKKLDSSKFSTYTQPSQNNNGYFNNGAQLNYWTIYGSTPYGDVKLSDIVVLDDTVLDANAFGEFNPVSGRWQAKYVDNRQLRFGPAGYRIDFKNIANDTSMMTVYTDLNKDGAPPVANVTTDWRIYGVPMYPDASLTDVPPRRGLTNI